jgi:hypothetical protein
MQIGRSLTLIPLLGFFLSPPALGGKDCARHSVAVEEVQSNRARCQKYAAKVAEAEKEAEKIKKETDEKNAGRSLQLEQGKASSDLIRRHKQQLAQVEAQYRALAKRALEDEKATRESAREAAQGVDELSKARDRLQRELEQKNTERRLAIFERDTGRQKEFALQRKLEKIGNSSPEGRTTSVWKMTEAQIFQKRQEILKTEDQIEKLASQISEAEKKVTAISAAVAEVRSLDSKASKIVKSLQQSAKETTKVADSAKSANDKLDPSRIGTLEEVQSDAKKKLDQEDGSQISGMEKIRQQGERGEVVAAGADANARGEKLAAGRADDDLVDATQRQARVDNAKELAAIEEATQKKGGADGVRRELSERYDKLDKIQSEINSLGPTTDPSANTTQAKRAKELAEDYNRELASIRADPALARQAAKDGVKELAADKLMQNYNSPEIAGYAANCAAGACAGEMPEQKYRAEANGISREAVESMRKAATTDNIRFDQEELAGNVTRESGRQEAVRAALELARADAGQSSVQADQMGAFVMGAGEDQSRLAEAREAMKNPYAAGVALNDRDKAAETAAVSGRITAERVEDVVAGVAAVLPGGSVIDMVRSDEYAERMAGAQLQSGSRDNAVNRIANSAAEDAQFNRTYGLAMDAAGVLPVGAIAKGGKAVGATDNLVGASADAVRVAPSNPQVIENVSESITTSARTPGPSSQILSEVEYRSPTTTSAQRSQLEPSVTTVEDRTPALPFREPTNDNATAPLRSGEDIPRQIQDANRTPARAANDNFEGEINYRQAERAEGLDPVAPPARAADPWFVDPRDAAPPAQVAQDRADSSSLGGGRLGQGARLGEAPKAAESPTQNLSVLSRADDWRVPPPEAPTPRAALPERAPAQQAVPERIAEAPRAPDPVPTPKIELDSFEQKQVLDEAAKKLSVPQHRAMLQDVVAAAPTNRVEMKEAFTIAARRQGIPDDEIRRMRMQGGVESIEEAVTTYRGLADQAVAEKMARTKRDADIRAIQIARANEPEAVYVPRSPSANWANKNDVNPFTTPKERSLAEEYVGRERVRELRREVNLRNFGPEVSQVVSSDRYAVETAIQRSLNLPTNSDDLRRATSNFRSNLARYEENLAKAVRETETGRSRAPASKPPPVASAPAAKPSYSTAEIQSSVQIAQRQALRDKNGVPDYLTSVAHEDVRDVRMVVYQKEADKYAEELGSKARTNWDDDELTKRQRAAWREIEPKVEKFKSELRAAEEQIAKKANKPEQSVLPASERPSLIGLSELPAPRSPNPRTASSRAPAAMVDDPSLIGVRADGPAATSGPRALQEIADRRVNRVLKEHSEFSAITAADNRKFMDLAARAETGQAKKSFFVTENAVLKRLNDEVVKDKDFVTALDNLHKDVLLREIMNDPVLKDVVVASYNDYKSIGFALERNNPQILRLLDEKIAKTNEGFNEFLKKVETAKGWKEKSIGLASDMRTWHHSGIGNTFQEAGLAARRSREIALESGQARLVNFSDESAHYSAATDRLAARSDEFAKKFKSATFVEKTPHGTALSEQAIETIRKAKPLGKSEADMDKAVQEAIGRRYGREISVEEASLLRSQLKDIDSVNPSLLIEKRVEINMGLHDEGLVSFDFKGQNSRNLYQTQMAVLKTKGQDMKTRLAEIAEGDRIATAQLDDMKARVEKAVASLGEKYVGKDVSKVVQRSGDDGIFHPLVPLGPAEKAKLAEALREQNVADAVRLTYLPKNYRNSDELIPVAERNGWVVEAEKIEKDLFTEHLVGNLPDDVFKGLDVKVDLLPAKDGRSAVGITFGHALGKPIPAKAEEIARKVLKDKYDIISVDRTPVAETIKKLEGQEKLLAQRAATSAPIPSAANRAPASSPTEVKPITPLARNPAKEFTGTPAQKKRAQDLVDKLTPRELVPDRPPALQKEIDELRMQEQANVKKAAELARDPAIKPGMNAEDRKRILEETKKIAENNKLLLEKAGLPNNRVVLIPESNGRDFVPAHYAVHSTSDQGFTGSKAMTNFAKKSGDRAGLEINPFRLARDKAGGLADTANGRIIVRSPTTKTAAYEPDTILLHEIGHMSRALKITPPEKSLSGLPSSAAPAKVTARQRQSLSRFSSDKGELTEFGDLYKNSLQLDEALTYSRDAQHLRGLENQRDFIRNVLGEQAVPEELNRIIAQGRKHSELNARRVQNIAEGVEAYLIEAKNRFPSLQLKGESPHSKTFVGPDGETIRVQRYRGNVVEADVPVFKNGERVGEYEMIINPSSFEDPAALTREISQNIDLGIDIARANRREANDLLGAKENPFFTRVEAKNTASNPETTSPAEILAKRGNTRPERQFREDFSRGRFDQADLPNDARAIRFQNSATGRSTPARVLSTAEDGFPRVKLPDGSERVLGAGELATAARADTGAARDLSKLENFPSDFKTKDLERIAPSLETSEYLQRGRFREWFTEKNNLDQGTKVYVGLTPTAISEHGAALTAKLRALNVPHKVDTDMKTYLANSLNGDKQTGKFITIYPQSDEQAREVAKVMKQQFKKRGIKPEDTLTPPGEYEVAPGISARYGAFTNANQGKLVTPAGEFVADTRGAGFGPEWAKNPFARAEDSAARVEVSAAKPTVAAGAAVGIFRPSAKRIAATSTFRGSLKLDSEPESEESKSRARAPDQSRATQITKKDDEEFDNSLTRIPEKERVPRTKRSNQADQRPPGDRKLATTPRTKDQPVEGPQAPAAPVAPSPKPASAGWSPSTGAMVGVAAVGAVAAGAMILANQKKDKGAGSQENKTGNQLQLSGLVEKLEVGEELKPLEISAPAEGTPLPDGTEVTVACVEPTPCSLTGELKMGSAGGKVSFPGLKFTSDHAKAILEFTAPGYAPVRGPAMLVEP